MLTLFIASLAILIYIFFGYPVILAILSMLFGKVVNKGDVRPKVSLIISAYNEQDVIKQKIENSLQLDYPKENLEIIVASESTDQTNDIVKEYQDQGVVLYAYENREGKRATLYRTVPLAKGEIIVFSDANAMYEKDAVTKIVSNFNDNRIGCVSGRLRYINSKDSSIGKGENAYWEYDLILKRMASRLFSLAGCGGVNGSIFAVRKELYDPIDKFRGDDFEISARVQINGHGVVMEPDAISYEEVSESCEQEFNRKVRLATWNIKSSLMLLAEALKKKRWLTSFLLFSHRFLRYITLVFLVLLLVSSSFLLSTNLALFFYLQLLFYFLAFIGWLLENRKFKLSWFFWVPFYFCMVNYAAFLGLAKNIFGKTEMLWEKAR
ncbi:MAG: glycosyltransferase family 2 protein [Planctomycetes bacterium]|nr:glycosyltransferase family 2 protein [Planctomycetota bacterium]